MKKKIFCLAMIAIALASFSSYAQQTETKNCKNTENCIKTATFNRQKSDPFQGLNLSDAQKTKLAALKENRQKDRVEKSKTARLKKMRADSLKATERMNQKREYLQEVKEIIGPDNYVVFLENMVINNGGRNHSMKSHGANFQKCGKNSSKTNKRNHHASRNGRNAQQSKITAQS